MLVRHNRWLLTIENRRSKPLSVLLVLLGFFATPPASAHCDTSPNLSANVPEFGLSRVSRIDALLRFGQSRNLCFGIEYVDAKLLTEVTDFDIRNTQVRDAIKVILGDSRPFTVRVNNGIVEISLEVLAGGTKSIFDHVVPKFEVSRATVQEASNALHLQLMVDLNPQIEGFAGHFSPGDLENLVGPFSERNRSVRYLLNELIAGSKGGAWISRVPWKLRGDLTMPERHPVWTVVEYKVPATGYGALLSSLVSDVAVESSSDVEEKTRH